MTTVTPMPTAMPAEKNLRVVVVVDTTGSMGHYCTSLSDTLPQIFSVLRVLTAGRGQVDIVAYEDYCDGTNLLRTCYGDEAAATKFAGGLRAGGGGDTPEASKTALNEVVRHLREAEEMHTIVLFYTDAPPHSARTGGSNYEKEKKALAQMQPGADWMAITRALREVGVSKTYTFVPPHHDDVVVRFQALLGPVVTLPDTWPATITKMTMGVLLQLMGQDFADEALGACVTRFVSGPALDGLSESLCAGYLEASVRNETRAGDSAKVEQLVLMGFGDAVAVEALRRSDGNAEVAVDLLVRWRGVVVEDEQQKNAGLVSLQRGTLDFAPVEGWACDLQALAPLFEKDESFREVVFRTLRELIVPDKAERALALTYNRVVGLLWRLACRRREDDRLAGLAEALSQCVGNLEGEQQTQLRTWIDESYDRSAEVCELVAGAGAGAGVYVLEAGPGVVLPSKDDMRSLVHSPTPAVLAAVQKLLTCVVFVDATQADAMELPHTSPTDGSGKVPLWAPAAFDDHQLFSMLPSLALPGLLVTQYPACIIAILAYLSGNEHLKGRAAALLERVKGRWIPKIEKLEDYPEILAAGFVRLVVRVPEFLTEEETALYGTIDKVLRVRKAQNMRVDVRCGYRPKKERLYHDEKAVCSQCKTARSLTLMKGGVCGLCHEAATRAQRGDDAAAGDGPASAEPAEGQSHLAECKTCSVVYAVVNPALLNVAPKCWYCRTGGVAPAVECTGCRNRFVRPDGVAEGAATTCGECAHRPTDCVHVEEAVYSKLQAENPVLYGLLGHTPADEEALSSTMSTYKLWNKHPELFAEPSAEAVAETATPALTWKKHSVMNAAEVCAQITTRVSKGDLADMCNLCFEDVAVAGLESACGTCSNVACQKCLKAWYSSMKPGCVYTPTLGLCPFCKRRPLGSTLAKYNKRACAVVTSKKHRVGEDELRADMCYAWCATCYKVKEAFPKVCGARVDEDRIKAFRCHGCVEDAARKEAEAAALRKGVAETALADPASLQCPKCAAPTFKAHGCNHISCLCGCEWCWECGGDFTNEDIYAHMMDAHGGIGIEY